jgi:hypothetical protein
VPQRERRNGSAMNFVVGESAARCSPLGWLEASCLADRSREARGSEGRSTHGGGSSGGRLDADRNALA